MEKKTFLGSIMRGDSWIWGIYWLLFFISVVEMFSASSRLVYKSMTSTDPVFRHMEFLFWGLGVVLVFQSLNIKAIRNWSIIIYAAGVSFLFALPVFGRTVNGAVRDVGGLQPAEICKVGLMMALCLAMTASDEFYYRFSIFRKNVKLYRYLFYLLIAAIVALPILTQNLSTALIISMATISLLWIGGAKGLYLRRTLYVVGACGLIGFAALYGLHEWDNANAAEGKTLVNLGPIKRAHTWASRVFDKDPIPLADQTPNDDNAQVIHAHMALANSYPFGKFIGNSQLRDLLPEAYSDYIYAIIFEETGFIGALCVMLLYIVLLGRCFYLAGKTSDPFIRLLMIALPLIMTIQALMHIGVCTDSMFVTGQPLPLISRGGSSILLTSVSLGIILALSRLIKAEREMQEANEVSQVQIESV